MDGRPRHEAAAGAPLAMDACVLGGGQVLTVAGRLDARTTPALRDLLHRLLDEGTGDLVLRLRDAEIGDATALGVLVGAHHRARRAGRCLVVEEVSPRTARVLRASRLHRVLLGPQGPSSFVVVPLTASAEK